MGLTNANLTSLTQLNLGNNQLTDLSVLADVNLTWLRLSRNQISDISVLAHLKKT